MTASFASLLAVHARFIGIIDTPHDRPLKFFKKNRELLKLDYLCCPTLK